MLWLVAIAVRCSRAVVVGKSGAPHVGAGCTMVSRLGPVKSMAVTRERAAAAEPARGLATRCGVERHLVRVRVRVRVGV